MNDKRDNESLDNLSGASVCPLCGGFNACSMARNVPGDEPCWCESVRLPQALLDRIPAETRNRSCICATCAGGEEPNSVQNGL